MIAEVHEIITPDGVSFDLNDGYARFVLRTPGNMGIPQVEPVTLQFGRQGKVYRDFLLQPRELMLEIRYQSCSRLEYWSGRLDLLEVLSPYRQGELWYRITLEDGTGYMIKGVIAGNPFPGMSEGWDEWGYTESLTIICNDPIWYSDTMTNTSFGANNDVQLVFPITFDDDHIFFGGTGGIGTTAITYTGTWYSYPVFVLPGPFTSVTLTHFEKQVVIQLTYTIDSNDSITIDVANRLVYNEAGTDLFGYLTGNTNLVDFRLEPAPVVAGGINTLGLDVQRSDTGPGSTSFLIEYYKRWIGI